MNVGSLAFLRLLPDERDVEMRSRNAANFRFQRAVIASLIGLFIAVFATSFGTHSVTANPCPAGWTYDAGAVECVRSFTTVGNEVWTPPSGVTTIKYLIVGGGGGGAQGAASSRGGAGGQVLTSNSQAISGAAITVTVGAGGGATVAGGLSRISWTGTTITANGGTAGGAGTGVGTTGPSNSLSGTSVVYGSNGGQGGGFAGGPGAGRGADNLGGCGGALAGTANRGGGGGGGGVCDFGFGPTPTTGAGGGSGIVIIRYGAFAVTSFTTANAVMTNSASLTYSLTFTSAVDATSLTPDDLSNAGTAIGCVFSISPNTGTATTFTVTVTGCSDGTVIPQLASGSVSPATGGSGPGAASDGSTVTIDTTAPNAPSAPDLVTASDTGLSTSDNITNDNTPAMSLPGGSNGDTATITATNGATSVSCSYVVGSASSCDLPTLSDGTWTISGTLTDQANNQSPAGPSLPIVVDTSAPTASGTPDLVASSDTGTSSTDNLTNDTTPAFSLPGAPDGHRVEFTATDGSTTKTCSYIVGSASSCDLPTLNGGSWSVTARVTDPAGNQSSPTSPLNFVVDTTAPNAPGAPDVAATSDTGSSNTDNNTRDNTPEVSTSGGSNGDTATITATNGSTTVSCTYVVGTATSCDLPTLSDGTWTLTSTLTDAAGNQSPSSSSTSLVVDATAPTAPTGADLLAASDSGLSNSDNNTSDNTPAMSLIGGVNGNTATISATNGSTTVFCSYVVGQASSCDLPTLSDGTWTVSGTFTDTAGNTSASGPSLPLVIDTSAPSASGTPDLVASSDNGSSNSDNITNDTTPSFSFPGAPDGHRVDFTATDGTNTRTCSYIVGQASSCDLPTLNGGSWSITGRVTDPAGNQSPSSSPLNFTIDTTAPSAPSAPDLVSSSDTGSSSTDNLTNDRTPEFSVPGGSNGDTATISATDGTNTVSCSYVVGSATSCSLPSMTDGTWTVSGVITDAAGNASPSGPSMNMTIDGTGPSNVSAPDLVAASDTGSSPTDDITADTTPDISVSGGSTGDVVTVNATKGGQTVSCTYVVGSATSCTLPTLGEGEWTISGFITDAAGNITNSPSSLSMFVDLSAPRPTMADLVDSSDWGVSNTDNLTADTTPDIAVSGLNRGDVVTVSATNGSKTVTCTYVIGSATSCTLPTLDNGSWNVTASVTDAVGNTGTTSMTLTILADEKAMQPPAFPNLVDGKKSSGSTLTEETSKLKPSMSIAGAAVDSTVEIVANFKGKTISCTYVVGKAKSCALATLTPGKWKIIGYVTDAAGNKSAASKAKTLTVLSGGSVSSTGVTPAIPVTGAQIMLLTLLSLAVLGAGVLLRSISRRNTQL